MALALNTNFGNLGLGNIEPVITYLTPVSLVSASAWSYLIALLREGFSVKT